jgi:5-methylcytosine-specific restriction endonuclease McrA
VSRIPLSLHRALRTEFPELRCAYCHSPKKLLAMPLEVDHIVPEVGGGKTELADVCLCCRTCNSYKGRRIRARDSLLPRGGFARLHPIKRTPDPQTDHASTRRQERGSYGI